MEQVQWRTCEATPPPKGWRRKAHSFSKLKIYMPGIPKPFTRYSYDWITDKARERNQKLGALRLKRLLETRFQGYKSAILVDLETDTILITYTQRGYNVH